MDVLIQLNGVDKLMRSSASFRSALPRTVLNAIRRQLSRTIATVKRDIRTDSGIGRTIWGKNGSGLNKVVTLIKARSSPDLRSIETGIKIKGIPAMVEEGGRIKAHFIRNGFGRKGNRIPHPGMTLRAHHFARRALDRDVGKILAEVRLSVQRLTDKTFSGPGLEFPMQAA